MGNLTTVLVFVLIANVIMIMAQVSIDHINISNPLNIYTTTGTILDKTGYANVTNTSDITTYLPEDSGIVQDSTGNFFVDVTSKVKSFFSKTIGLSYVYDIATAPGRMIAAMNLPAEFTFLIGSFWYGLTIFLVVSFIFGRET